MKLRKHLSALMLGLALCLPVTAFADSVTGDPNWGVTFTAQSRMESNFNLREFNDAIYGMQPGDDVTITLKLRNDHQETTNWYMTNTVLQSLEDTSKTASGGAYTYILTYTNVKGEDTVLFNSDTVGGEGIVAQREGLHAATDNLEDFFYLDTLTNGQQGMITLHVALDGETQGNDYQDTLAELQMNFAVELETPAPPSTPNTPPPSTTVVKTGDDTNMIPYFVIAAVSGVALLLLGGYGLKLRKDEKKEGGRR